MTTKARKTAQRRISWSDRKEWCVRRYTFPSAQVAEEEAAGEMQVVQVELAVEATLRADGRNVADDADDSPYESSGWHLKKENVEVTSS